MEKVSVRFTIEDTGIGMSEEFQKRMFDPFTQENESVHGKYTGTGLGMAIVKSNQSYPQYGSGICT